MNPTHLLPEQKRSEGTARVMHIKPGAGPSHTCWVFWACIMLSALKAYVKVICQSAAGVKATPPEHSCSQECIRSGQMGKKCLQQTLIKGQRPTWTLHVLLALRLTITVLSVLGVCMVVLTPVVSEKMKSTWAESLLDLKRKTHSGRWRSSKWIVPAFSSRLCSRSLSPNRQGPRLG